MRRSRIVLAAVLTSIIVGTANARTWYVSASGHGDVETIEAGVDSAGPGDTVLVSTGHYYPSETIYLDSGVHLISEFGPAFTTLWPQITTINYAFVVLSGAVLEGFYIRDWWNYVTVYVGGPDATVSSNIIATSQLNGNGMLLVGTATINNNVIGASGKAVKLFGNMPLVLNNNIILHGTQCQGGGGLIATCNDARGGTDGCDAILADASNFDLNPMFCTNPALHHRLNSASPCAPGNHPNGVACGLIGALGVSCGAVPVEQRTWGAIKQLYR